MSDFDTYSYVNDISLVNIDDVELVRGHTATSRFPKEFDSSFSYIARFKLDNGKYIYELPKWLLREHTTELSYEAQMASGVAESYLPFRNYNYAWFRYYIQNLEEGQRFVESFKTILNREKAIADFENKSIKFQKGCIESKLNKVGKEMDAMTNTEPGTFKEVFSIMVSDHKMSMVSGKVNLWLDSYLKDIEKGVVSTEYHNAIFRIAVLKNNPYNLESNIRDGIKTAASKRFNGR